MSILDDAIREHLELKRAHGADESELKKLENEAFGPPQRPDEADAFAEAPTEFMTAEGAGDASPDVPSGRRAPNIADLQEAPPPPEAPAPEAAEEPPAQEEHPATEQEAVPDSQAEEPLQPEASHTTQERHAIAEQPTEYFDVEAEIEGEPEAPAEAAAPSDDDLVDAEQSEPRLAPVDPLTHIEAEVTEAEAAEEPLLEDAEEEDDFFSEQRLSDELNQALETPAPGEPQLDSRTEEPIPPGPHTEEAEAHYAERDAEREDDEVREPEEEPEPTQLYDFDAEDEPSEEAAEPEPIEDEPDEDDEEPDAPAAAYEPDTESHDDVLEDTPKFLEDAPEDDDLWFEQRPPKDFDFDD